ncbi:MAG: heme exporter protein CcmB [Herpetosiphon sp.]
MVTRYCGSTVGQRDTVNAKPLLRSSGLFAASWAVFLKDVRSETRTRYALNALVMFALSTVVTISINLGTHLLRTDPVTPLIDAVLLWIAILFGALTGLGRSFVQEESAQTAALLRLHAAPLAVFLGKWLFNLVLVSLLGALTTSAFGLLVSLNVGNISLLTVVIVLGCAGMATATTLIAAIIAQANVRSALLAPLALPILLPLLILAVQSTDLALTGAAWKQAAAHVQALSAYVVVIGTGAVGLFPSIWEA